MRVLRLFLTHWLEAGVPERRVFGTGMPGRRCRAGGAARAEEPSGFSGWLLR